MGKWWALVLSACLALALGLSLPAGATAATPTLAPPAVVNAKVSGCSTAAPKHVRECRRLARNVLGHRCRHYPASHNNENTLEALERAWRKGVGCESDTTRIAADDGTPHRGVNVIFHDMDRLTRNTTAESRAEAGVPDDAVIGEVTLAQFRILRTTGGERMPTLKRFVRFASRHRVPTMIELKWVPADPAEVAGWVRRFGGERYVSFYQRPLTASGPHPCSLSGARALIAQGLTVGVKGNQGCDLDPAVLAADGFSFLVVHTREITPASVQAAHRAGLRIGNSNSKWPSQWRKLVRTGADFAIAPRPAALKRWLLR
jgi:glycerophosphoryl diester phosphodiesterase